VLMVLIPIIIVAGIGAFAVAMLMGPAGRLRPSEAAAAH
jgi:hypothetical protein